MADFSNFKPVSGHDFQCGRAHKPAQVCPVHYSLFFEFELPFEEERENQSVISGIGNARGGGMGIWIFTSDYVAQWGCYPLGNKISGANAEPATTYDHASSGPSYFYTTGGPVILGEGDYPWINIQYAPGEPITQLSWKEGDDRIYTFSGGDLGPETLQGRWASYDGNHAVYHTSSGLVWHDLGHDTSYLIDKNLQIPYAAESYNNYLSVDASTILLQKSEGDRANWRLVILQVAVPSE